MTSDGPRPGPETVERKADGVTSDSVDDITVGAVPHRRRKLDTVPALVDGLTTLTLEADGLTMTPRSPLEAWLTMAGAGARMICRMMTLGRGVMTATDPT